MRIQYTNGSGVIVEPEDANFAYILSDDESDIAAFKAVGFHDWELVRIDESLSEFAAVGDEVSSVTNWVDRLNEWMTSYV